MFSKASAKRWDVEAVESATHPLRIPFNKPCLVGKELTYIADAILGGHASGDGAYTQKCHAFLERLLGVPKVLLTTSCTHALEMAALLLDIQPGDEVIVPSFTFVSTVNAFVLRGAQPVFADVRPDTLNIDETQLERLITSRTKAIVVVHYAGVGCEMDAIMEIAHRCGVAVVEDNAHGLFGGYKGKPLGTFGCLATQSFHETKNIQCGEGGALIINDPQFIERAEIIREKGTNRNRFFRGLVDKYTWVDIGSSYLPSDILAAFLYAQLEAWEQIQAKRRYIFEYYAEHLHDWARERHVRLPIVPEHCQQAYHMFYLLLPSLKQRQALIAHLKARGILSVFHYQPLHLSEMGLRFGGKPGDCPVTEDVSDRLLRLPFYNELTDAELSRIVAAIREFHGE
ncbi:MAG: dTDP-4-amino-4,6-dideoxygalactose transaminase [Abditibacteriales bacterium]|nr:dTDP-4-amino-4,6-dideoxygalactose transaminase [Abditibacteriales bacterium]MDW8368504.1 dTDP-4-amino-4,6-dideoxygalactose transaminase [Abditibacteriales bacterium]